MTETCDEIDDVGDGVERKRLGCVGQTILFGALFLMVLGIFLYANLVHSPQLIISRETTYLTEPLTADGTRVDYLAALEKERYPPDMKTDNNGYRLIVRAIGLNGARSASGYSESEAQVREKLGLDPTAKPAMTYQEPGDFLAKYCLSQGVAEDQAFQWESKVGSEPWTLEDYPMMESWLQENNRVVDVVEEAVRKPTFFMPFVRPSDQSDLDVGLTELQHARSLARIVSARANYRVGTGDIDGAIRDVITCKRLGRHMKCQKGPYVSGLVGVAIEGVAQSLGVAANRDAAPSKAQLQYLADELAALPATPDLKETLLAERYYALSLLQQVARRDRSAAELIWNEEDNRVGKLVARLPVDWNIVLWRVNQRFDELMQQQSVQQQEPSSQRELLSSPACLLIGPRSQRIGDMLATDWSVTSAVQEADHRSQCAERLQAITLAMLMYERDHGTLPPAWSVDSAGQPLHSWRVLLLPYLGQQELYEQLRLDQPWNSEHNRQVHEAAPAVYQCPSALLGPGQTCYSVIVGERTAFSGGTGKSLDDFGMHLLLVIERELPVCWMAPTSELMAATALRGINTQEAKIDEVGSEHSYGVMAGLRGGCAQVISSSLSPHWWQGLLEGTLTEPLP